ncbi:hypothetical protein, partial [Photobacterium sanctipauli]
MFPIKRNYIYFLWLLIGISIVTIIYFHLGSNKRLHGVKASSAHSTPSDSEAALATIDKSDRISFNQMQPEGYQAPDQPQTINSQGDQTLLTLLHSHVDNDEIIKIPFDVLFDNLDLSNDTYTNPELSIHPQDDSVTSDHFAFNQLSSFHNNPFSGQLLFDSPNPISMNSSYPTFSMSAISDRNVQPSQSSLFNNSFISLGSTEDQLSTSNNEATSDGVKAPDLDPPALPVLNETIEVSQPPANDSNSPTKPNLPSDFDSSEDSLTKINEPEIHFAWMAI